MKRFIIRAFFLVIVLLFGILFGTYQASIGPLSSSKIVESIETKEISEKGEKQENNRIVEKKRGKDSDSVQKKNIEIKDLAEKQERADAVNAFNFYSELGSKIGEMFQALFSSLLTTIVGTVHGLLHP